MKSTTGKPKKPKSHFHVLPTPLLAAQRWVAREIKRKLIRDQLRGKLPREIAEAVFAVRECVGKCMEQEQEESAK